MRVGRAPAPVSRAGSSRPVPQRSTSADEMMIVQFISHIDHADEASDTGEIAVRSGCADHQGMQYCAAHKRPLPGTRTSTGR
jgi:hypothetical protein